MAEKSPGWRIIHLHTLRKFFRTECEIARMPRPMIDILMGHRGRGDGLGVLASAGGRGFGCVSSGGAVPHDLG
ncbi:MAG: hypothetical protein ACE5KH_00040 [Candidatus Geothermarchaeales archaeon]